MIFQQFKNIEIINEIRNRYDPLAKLVRPHITLVFPFENEMSNVNKISVEMIGEHDESIIVFDRGLDDNN
jgi:2'-5' RNA ligase